MTLLKDDPYRTDYKPAFARLMQRIDAAEREKQVLEGVAPKSRSWFVWLGSPWTGATAAVLLAGLMMSILGPDRSQGVDENYRTLTINKSGSRDATRRVLIEFEPDSQGDLVRSVLVTLNATIVSSPDADGKYLIDLHIPPEKSPRKFVDSIGKMQGVKGIVMLEIKDNGAD